MIELIGHPRARIELDLGEISEDDWARIVLFEVLEIDRPPGKRYRAWLECLPVSSEAVSAIVERVQVLRTNPVSTQAWKAPAIGDARLRETLSPVLVQFREVLQQFSTTWKLSFLINDEFTAVDHRGIVIVGELDASRVVVKRIFRAGDPQHPEWNAKQRVSSVTKSLRQQCLARAGKIDEQDFCCPDPAGRSVNSAEWPDHFPANCPPCALPDANGDVFHLVSSASEDNFVSSLQKRKTTGWSGDCDKAALSCFRTLAGVAAMRTYLISCAPAFRLRRIARLRLNASDGKLARTGPTPDHYSLWLRREALANIHTNYELLDEDP